ncbi:ABC transporter permease [Prosthecomicrobium sp. N25]|uniref:ABC transporter permease n=1 Tax=Prosthecomicrobium sp. N25 TaxID=3129254 RepID=UPI003077B419
MNRSAFFWLGIGWVGFAFLPWYGFSTARNSAWPPTGLSAALGEAPWLLPLALALALPLPFLALQSPRAGRVLLVAGAAGLAWLIAQGLAIGLRGWSWTWLADLAVPLEKGQRGMGLGALAVAAAFLFFLTIGLASGGAMKGDRFTTGAIGLVVAAISVFVFWPVSIVLVQAGVADPGESALAAFVARLTARDIWSLNCVMATGRCGVFWNSITMATLAGLLTTLLGLAFALVATRTGFRFKTGLRLLTVLPIITPPFVIGLAVILLFGRNGTITLLLADQFGLTATRYIYGLPGILLTQTLAFTPIAFLVLIGVVQGIAPAMEEAAQTLRASRWQTFRHVTWPLMRPGLANAFLVGFIESLADFGNPLVMGGGYEVLSTKIFFAVVGAQNDPGRAAALSIVLLCLCVGAFLVQRLWVGKKSYTTVGGKGFAGTPAALPRGLKIAAYSIALPWAAFTFVLYGLILFGGFVENWGRNNSLTLKHYITAFGLEWGDHGLVWAGRAWNSLFTTLEIAAASAPLTAGIGLLTAYLLVRQRFVGQSAFEFMTMLSFAIPGTVIGVSYILAFNTPPVELTGTAVILVICFVFRNMPVSIRAGVAAMSQIDKSLDECALTLGASSAQTVRTVILPLLRPAVVAALVYSFVRAITSVSAVIFLVSARHDMATSYIVGRVEVGDFGLAIAYASALIVLMGLGILLIQGLVGERRIARRDVAAAPLKPAEVPA